MPFATRQLADLGARVIKVERPGTGDFARGYDRSVLGQASYFVWLNRGKESVELDVKSADGQAALAALLDRADVFVQNLAPGAAERLGLGADELRARHPRLICCSVSGYGAGRPVLPARRPMTCWCSARPGCFLSPARRTSRARRASRSPTSPPGCTPTAGC